LARKKECRLETQAAPARGPWWRPAVSELPNAAGFVE
jgi:hypothetical protein